MSEYIGTGNCCISLTLSNSLHIFNEQPSNQFGARLHTVGQNTELSFLQNLSHTHTRIPAQQFQLQAARHGGWLENH